MKRRYFGTDGVRGPFNGPLINPTFAARLAQAAGQWAGGLGRVLIGRDTRASGEILAAAVARGVAAAGLEPITIGVAPTPAVSRAVATGDAVLGVVITASHNPASDNGIKFFNRHGVKLTDADELQIESFLPEQETDVKVEAATEAGARRSYVGALSEQLPANALSGWRIVLDVANGATSATSPEVLRNLGADLVIIGDEPNGTNINAGVGSEHPEQLADAVRQHHARVGIAHDGDGDRCVLCDETGTVLDGDEVLALLGVHALQHNELPNNLLVVTVQSNLGVDAAIRNAGGRVLRTDVGDRYVAECMRREGAGLGGESSGHIICNEVGPTGDGLGAALRVLRVMHTTGKPLSELRQVLQKFPQRTGALRVAEKLPLDGCANLQTTIAALESEMGASGRVLVRYSGTEPKLRLLIEGPDDASVNSGYDRLAAAAARDLIVVQ